VEVVFPDGTRIRASSIFERDEDASGRDFGLYMDPRWNPSWPAEIIAWPDFGVPAHGARAVAQIRSAFIRAKSGQSVEIGCMGGLGRTGTVLAAWRCWQASALKMLWRGCVRTTAHAQSRQPIRRAGSTGSHKTRPVGTTDESVTGSVSSFPSEILLQAGGRSRKRGGLVTDESGQ
jgi:hypothetical protein